MKKHFYNIWLICGMIMLSILYCLPLFYNQNLRAFNNQDLLFHLTRTIGISNVLSSPVNFLNYADHGTMANTFYPWIFLFPLFILYKLTGSIVIGYKLFFLIITFATMVIAYFSVHSITKNRNSAFLFSVLYSFSLYRTTDLYYRSSFGEVLAMSFLPLVVLGFYQVIFGDYTKWYWLTLSVSALLYTHLLSAAVMVIMLLVAFICAVYSMNQLKQRLKSLVLSGTLFILVALGFIVPFIIRSHENSLSVPPLFKLQGNNLGDLFLFSLNNNIGMNSIGITTTVALVITIVYYLKHRANLSNFKHLIFYSAIIVLILSSSLFPWSIFNGTPIAQIQFVWRLNAFSTVMILMAFSIIVLPNVNLSKGAILSIVAFVVLINFSSLNALYNDPQKIFTNLTESRSTNDMVADYYHSDYSPKIAYGHKEQLSQPIDTINKDIISKVKICPSTYTIGVNNLEKRSKRITVPVYYYKNQIVKLNGSVVKSSESSIGTTIIQIPSGKSNIAISYKYYIAEKISFIISALSTILLVIYMMKPKYYKTMH
ncbi:hypothetical protein EFM21_06915 [Leuconostoc falkenbergense]|uniref:hypothetical protein n=1 Tax=Leuconostoc falkenbergense TaxID=2766470 RepID=UPI0021AAB208|nr:hypothetical protein [Leuconostoc falkenbergense]MCT4378886.1 hypothetical protein [Leuconostoc falkenbergense]MDV8950900.1 hypothetical protein [Leuconostoc falkenbergense]